MKTNQSSAILIADLGYGDAGKGSVVDYLARTAPVHTVVRYNGGAQAAHNVITPDGRRHTFAQFGSASFLPGVRTHLSRFMLLHPLALLAEERQLRALGVGDAFERLSIERGALVITPFQQAANRLKEIARGDARHGSCGMGIGETTSDWLNYGSAVLFAGDLANRAALLHKLRFVREAKLAQLADLLPGLAGMPAAAAELKVLQDPQVIEATADLYRHVASLVRLVEADHMGLLLRQPGVTVFEGAQGVLLDERWGFYPYNSWSKLTFQNADALLTESSFTGEIFKLGLIRGYATRHGAGPFVSEDREVTERIPEWHNADNPWQRQFRAGYLDLVALRYALGVTGAVDGLAVTNLDRMEALPEWRTCERYRAAGGAADAADLFEWEDGLAREIRIFPVPPDKPRQERLTRALMSMQPVCTVCERQQEPYLEHISQQLGVPLALTSWGPTAEAKAVVSKRLARAMGIRPKLSAGADRLPYKAGHLASAQL